MQTLLLFISCVVCALSTTVWNGNFNEYASTSDLNNWSWSNQVGPYQTYIYGNNPSSNTITTWAHLDASFKNPADALATKGVKIHWNASSIWNGNPSWRCEFIPNYDQSTVQTGNLYFIWSMKQDSAYPLRQANEHQLVFFESHYIDLKYGGSNAPAGKLYLVTNSQSTPLWSIDFPVNTWLTFALNVDYTNKKIAFYTIDTASNTATQVVSPTSVSVDTNQWHIGGLRLADNSGSQDPTPEILYYSSISLQTDLNNLPFANSGSSSTSSSSSMTATTSTSSSSSTSGADTTTITTTTSSSTTTSGTTGAVAKVSARVTVQLSLAPTSVDLSLFVTELAGVLSIPVTAITEATLDADKSNSTTTVIEFVISNEVKDDGSRVDPVAAVLELRQMVADNDPAITGNSYLAGIKVLDDGSSSTTSAEASSATILGGSLVLTAILFVAYA